MSLVQTLTVDRFHVITDQSSQQAIEFSGRIESCLSKTFTQQIKTFFLNSQERPIFLTRKRSRSDFVFVMIVVELLQLIPFQSPGSIALSFVEDLRKIEIHRDEFVNEGRTIEKQSFEDQSLSTVRLDQFSRFSSVHSSSSLTFRSFRSSLMMYSFATANASQAKANSNNCSR